MNFCKIKSIYQISTITVIVAVLVTTQACSDNSLERISGDSNNPALNFRLDQEVGTSARELLTDENFTSIIVEVDWIEDFKPSQAGLDSLEVFLEKRLHKPSGIDIIYDESIPSPGLSEFEVEDIRELEAEYRDRKANNRTLVIYMLALNARSSDANVLGVAYNNTSLAVFQREILVNSGNILQPPQEIVEGAVMRHEFGHLMGLVNNGTPMIGDQDGVEDHHDEENGAHCTVEESLMHFQIRTSNFGESMMKETIPKLEPLDIRDLRANGGK